MFFFIYKALLKENVYTLVCFGIVMLVIIFNKKFQSIK